MLSGGPDRSVGIKTALIGQTWARHRGRRPAGSRFKYLNGAADPRQLRGGTASSFEELDWDAWVGTVVHGYRDRPVRKNVRRRHRPPASRGQIRGDVHADASQRGETAPAAVSSHPCLANARAQLDQSNWRCSTTADASTRSRDSPGNRRTAARETAHSRAVTGCAVDSRSRVGDRPKPCVTTRPSGRGCDAHAR